MDAASRRHRESRRDVAIHYGAPLKIAMSASGILAMTLGVIANLAIIFITVCLLSCSSGQREREYRHTVTEEITVQNAVPSQELIDGEKTYEITFRLKEPADCLKIGITSTFQTDSLPSKKLPARTFFLVERVLDISQFAGVQGTAFTLMGKNFTTQWEQQPVITICPPTHDPLQRLDSKSLYRVRFSALLGIDFVFNVTIQSDSKIEMIR